MKTILILGAGLSASSLIRYLIQHAEKNNWQLRIVDRDIKLIEEKTKKHPSSTALSFNALNSEERMPEIEKADIVISMLPARFHVPVAEDCIKAKTNLITPSYISSEMKALDEKAKEAGIVIMNEIGVDPGIDHMSAMKIIDEIKSKGAVLKSFKSFCGGLIAPESDNNPWNYKFTWNPRNVVLAGQGPAAKFIQEGRYKYIPYNSLFKRTRKISIDGFGDFEGYANRDSLSYRSTYGLNDIPTIYRGTLRRPEYCAAWNVFVELGMTDDSYDMDTSKPITNRQFLNAFLPFNPTKTVEEKMMQLLGEERKHLYEKLAWLGIFEESNLNLSESTTPAQLLQQILVKKLSLDKDDKDMLVMLHEFEFTLNGEQKKITSHMVNIGEDQVYTSMSNTVGLPVAICAKHILNETFNITGVTLPISKDVYNPILSELAENGIVFIEKEG